VKNPTTDLRGYGRHISAFQEATSDREPEEDRRLVIEGRDPYSEVNYLAIHFDGGKVMNAVPYSL
jgi:hypothetical protein